MDNQLTDGGEVVSLTHQLPFTPQEDSWYSFLLEAVNPRDIVWLERLGQLKNSMTSSGIEPATFRPVVLCLNQLHYCVSPFS
jgi:hypothetical protein